MVRSDNDMLGHTTLDAIIEKVETAMMFLVETHPIQWFIPAAYPSKVIDPHLCGTGIFDTDMAPQCRENQVGIPDPYYVVVVICYIGAYLVRPTVMQAIHVEAVIELMVARNHNDLLVVVRRPIPKRVPGTIISEITDISSQDEHIARNLQRMLFEVAGVLCKFQMQVGSILDTQHNS